MRTRVSHVVLTAAIVGAMSVSTARGAVPSVPQFLTEQGRLFDAMNNPVTGSTKFVFSLYTAPSGGTALWTETQTITLDSGFFSAQLGEVTAIPASTFATAAANASTLYLGIQVNSDPELSPRQPLLSVPFAFVAGNVIGDISPHSISVGGKTVVDGTGTWVGSATGLQGPAGPTGPAGPAGPAGPTGPAGATGGTGPQGPSGTNGTNGTNGAPGPAGVMISNSAPAAGTGSPGAILNGSSSNYIYPVTGFNVGAASSKCQVTSTGFFCVSPVNNGGTTSPTVPINSGVDGAYRTSGGSNTDAPAYSCYLPAPVNGSQCTACTISAIVPVTAGGSYDFGCDIIVPGATTGTGGFCAVSVSCF